MSGMPEPPNDRIADANLRRLRAHLDVPVAPTARERERWRQADPAVRRSSEASGPRPRRSQAGMLARAGAWLMRHPRMTFAGSAMAAAVTFAAMLFVLPAGGRLEAAVILSSFRETLRDGFKLSVANIAEEDLRVNATIAATFNAPANGGEPDVDDVEALYLEADVQATGPAADIPWENIHVVFAMQGETAWAFLKMSAPREGEFDDEPVMMVLNSYFERGVLIKLDGLLDTLRSTVDHTVGSIWGEMSSEIEANFEGDLAHLADLADLGGIEEAGDADVTRDIRVEIDREVRTAALEGVQLEGLTAELETTLGRLISGDARGEDLAQIVELLAQAAETVDVRQVERGVHVLTASNFKFDEMGETDAEETAFVRNMAMDMRYREGRGVEQARLLHLGELDGSVIFETADAAAVAELMDLDRIIGQQRPMVIDLSQLEPLIKAALEQAEIQLD